MTGSSIRLPDRRTSIFVSLVLLLAIPLFWTALNSYQIVDDAFITYRYAANLVGGHGLVYNEGQAVLGTTTPGYAIILAALALITGSDNLPVISLTLNAVLLVIVLVNSGLIAYAVQHDRRIAAMFVLMLLLSKPVMGTGGMGMETPLFLALLTTGYLAFLGRHWLWAALVLGLLAPVRPEGGFAMGLLALAAIIALRQRQITLKQTVQVLILLGLPGAADVIATTLYYGSPIPHSVQAKMAGLYPFSRIQTTGQMFLKAAHFIPYSAVNPAVFLLAIPITFWVLVAGARWLARQRSGAWFIPALYLLMVIFFSLSRTMLFPWYDGLYYPLYLACLWAGLFAVGDYVARRLVRPARFDHQRAAGVLSVTWIMIMLVVQMPWNLHRAFDNPPLDRNREILYYNLAHQIGPLLPANTQIAMPEIGVLGYYLPRVRVLDSSGLVSPEATSYLPIREEECTWGNGGCVPRALIRDQQPDMVIFVETLGRDSLLNDPVFLNGYHLVIEWHENNKLFAEDGLFVYARRDFEPGIALGAHDFAANYPMPLK